ncbi:GNAT family N-acetyltransferase [Pedobacter sp. HMWF019]|uniref:GNAT family N-acetyltransferase n=1 Tax=Pedobacter sp. HMWF019 TaxID=2056856 RepID=UPI000D377B17|nr:GNAT family N-acetyltransferase [Pedobacter sp. HMWF019]PTS94117.1 GNAT family N-acetyltransferase [Pedobacter sp. HMWF019]
MNFTLVHLDISTISDLQKLAQKTFFETYAAYNSAENMQYYLDTNFSIKKLQEEISNPDSIFFTALNTENKHIGYIKVNFRSAQTDLKDQNTMEVERIYVLQEFQGQKAGQFLLNNAIEIARKNHVDNLWLGVWEKNNKAIAFYKRNQFTDFDTHIFKFGDDEQLDILMKFDL